MSEHSFKSGDLCIITETFGRNLAQTFPPESLIKRSWLFDSFLLIKAIEHSNYSVIISVLVSDGSKRNLPLIGIRHVV